MLFPSCMGKMCGNGKQQNICIRFLGHLSESWHTTTDIWAELTVMNPAGQSYEAVPLQGSGGQPAGSTVVQYTTVTMSTEPAKDHVVWSLCTCMYGNICCLGLAALIFSFKVGSYHGLSHSETPFLPDVLLFFLSCSIFFFFLSVGWP